MTAPLHSCVVRFWNRSDSGLRAPVGTGFLAQGADGVTYVLTCAHVANVVFGRRPEEGGPLESGTTSVDVFGRGAAQIELCHWIAPLPVGEAKVDPIADIAVFAVTRSSGANPYCPPLRIEPPRIVVPDGSRTPFHSFGFMGPHDGDLANGVLKAVDAGGWFVAEVHRGFGRFLASGLSGAPIFANGRILGMVVQHLGRDVREGLVVPAMVLAQAWPPLAQPYPGLSAFNKTTAHLYFGRGRPIEIGQPATGTLSSLLAQLSQQRLVGIMGASGSGKSSLANAGAAAIYEAEGWAVISFRPATQPLLRLAEAIAIASSAEDSVSERIRLTEEWHDRLEKGRFDEAVTQLRALGARGALVVIDQFEEFFTAEKDTEEEMARQRSLILNQLARAINRDDVRCVFAGRLDLMERMLTADPLAASLLIAPYLPFPLAAMRAGAIRDAIEGPARLFGVQVDVGLATELAADAAREASRLPMLQLALQRLWGNIQRVHGTWRMERPSPNTTVDGREADSELELAVRDRAEEGIADVLRGGHGRPKVTDVDLQRVLLGLVRTDIRGDAPTRRIRVRSKTDTKDWKVLEELAEQRLLTLSLTPDGYDATAELSHEALLTRWPRLFDLIIKNRSFLAWRDRFNNELEFWEARGKRSSDLLREEDLSFALNWLEHPDAEQEPPTNPQRDFTDASRRYHQDRRNQELAHAQQIAAVQSERAAAERAAAIRVRRWLYGASLAAAVAFLALMIAVSQWFKAAKTVESLLRTEETTLRVFGRVYGKALAESATRTDPDNPKLVGEVAVSLLRALSDSAPEVEATLYSVDLKLVTDSSKGGRTDDLQPDMDGLARIASKVRQFWQDEKGDPPVYFHLSHDNRCLITVGSPVVRDGHLVAMMVVTRHIREIAAARLAGVTCPI